MDVKFSLSNPLTQTRETKQNRDPNKAGKYSQAAGRNLLIAGPAFPWPQQLMVALSRSIPGVGQGEKQELEPGSFLGLGQRGWSNYQIWV